MEDPKAVQALINPRDAEFVRPFLGHERTLTEAAVLLGVRRDTMLYRIERLLKLGILRVTSVQRGRGRPVRRYSTVAAGFIISFAVTQAPTVLEVLLHRDSAQREQLAGGLLASVVGESGWHLRIYWDPVTRRAIWAAVPDHDPTWHAGRLLEPAAPAAWYTNLGLTLTHPQAKALQHELAALFTKYQSAAGAPAEDARAYTLQLGLSPLVSVQNLGATGPGRSAGEGHSGTFVQAGPEA